MFLKQRINYTLLLYLAAHHKQLHTLSLYFATPGLRRFHSISKLYVAMKYKTITNIGVVVFDMW